MGSEPSSPSATIDISASGYAANGTVVTVNINVNNIKPASGIFLAGFMLYYDPAKVTPVIKSDGVDNEAMRAFIKKQPDGWEPIFGLKSDSSGSYYDLALLDANLKTAAKSNGAISLSIQFTVNQDAEGDILFYVPHTSAYVLADDLKSLPAKGSYAVVTVKNTADITFESRGGTSVPSQTVNIGSKVTKPTSPEREGYNFLNWYTSTSFSTVYDFNSAVSGDMTLYAGWEIKRFTVSFNTLGGSSVASQTVKWDSTASRPSNPTRKGYTFLGWYTSETLEENFDFSTHIKQDTTVYAGWQENAEVSEDVSGEESSEESGEESAEESGDISQDVSQLTSEDISGTESNGDASSEVSEDNSSEESNTSSEAESQDTDVSAEASDGDASSAVQEANSPVPKWLFASLIAFVALAAVSSVILTLFISRDKNK